MNVINMTNHQTWNFDTIFSHFDSKFQAKPFFIREI